MNNKKYFLIVYIFLLFIGIIFNNIDVLKIYMLPQNIYSNYEEVESINRKSLYGKYIVAKLDKNNLTSSNLKNDTSYITFKLFGFIPIRKIKTKIIPTEKVYLGGVPIGLHINSNGIVVVSDKYLSMQNKSFIKSSLEKGDIILKINNKEVCNSSQIEDILKNNKSDKINITIKHNNKILNNDIDLLKDDNKYKLGTWVKDDFSGAGTLTFIKQNLEFASLGHSISFNNVNNLIDVKNGEVYSCNIIKINKGKKNSPGEIQCILNKQNKLGKVYKNTESGVFGKLNGINELIDSNLMYSLGGRYSVKPGKAYIVSSISGIREEYEIEIIKANHQSKSKNKSILFRVTDKRLLDETGGIIQGMSGSPIIQNNKIVGAVTHVFISDSSKGYGIYTDWMLDEMTK